MTPVLEIKNMSVAIQRKTVLESTESCVRVNKEEDPRESGIFQ